MTRSRVAASAAGVLLLAALAFPIYWMTIASLSPERELFESPSLLPHTPFLGQYRALFDERDFLTPIRNSTIVAAATTAIGLPIAALCAYAVARLRVPGRTVLLALVLAVSMFPQVSIIPPLYLALRSLHLLDSYPGLVLPYLTLTMPLGIWLLTAFFRDLPREVEDAARLDGASRVRVLIEIVLPLAMPALASTAILMFLYCWNEFLFALSFALGPERYTVPVAIALFRGQYQVPWGEILAAAVVATLPVAAIVFAFQRRIVAGLTSGASKG